MGPQYPELVERRRAHPRASRSARRRPSSRPSAKGATDLRPRPCPRRAQAGGVLSGRAGVPAARHLRLPDRPHAGDGGRAGPVGRRGRLPRAHGRAARRGPRPTPRRKKTGHVDVSAYRDAARRGRRDRASPATARCAPRRVVRGLLVDGDVGAGGRARATTSRSCSTARPFYAEGGGQLADAGPHRAGRRHGACEVDDVQKPLPDLVVHRGARRVAARRASARRSRAEVDVERRRAVSRAHTATHLVHKAFRAALGEHGHPGRLAERPGPLPLRLRLARRRARVACWPTSSRRSTRSRSPTSRSAPSSRPRTRRGASARWRCSARSTATRSASSRSATTPASSAAARTPPAPASSAWSSCCRRPRSAPACAASRASSASTPTRYLAREHVLLAQLAVVASRCRPRRCPDRVAATVARLREVEKELAQLRAGAGAAAGGRVRRRRPGRLRRRRTSASRRPPARPATSCAQLALDVRGRIAAERPGVVLVAAGGERVTLVAAVNDAGRARGLSANARAARGRRRPSTARAAARTTSPRAAAPTPPASPTRWCGPSTWSAGWPRLADVRRRPQACARAPRFSRSGRLPQACARTPRSGWRSSLAP